MLVTERAGKACTSADDHHRARGMLRDAVGGRPEEMVAQEVTAVAEHDEVEATRGREVGDDLGGVPRAQLDRKLDVGLGGLLARSHSQPEEEEVLFPLDLVDLANGRRVRRKRSFDRERCASVTPASSSAFANA